MPVFSARRQAEPSPNRWFQRADVTAMVESVQREVIPELTRVFGHDGLYLRASDAIAPQLSGNLLAQVLNLHRSGHRFAGELHCEDAALPLLGNSQSLVCVSFVLETSGHGDALLAEIARVLKPEGVLLLLTLNPWCPLRLRWIMSGLAAQSLRHWHGRLQAAGLAIERQRPVGPVWATGRSDWLAPEQRLGWMRHLRMAQLTIARRREAGVTPLRWASPAMGFGHGVGAS